MERFHGVGPVRALRIAQHVEGDAVVYVLAGANAVDGLLHLAVTAVAPLHGVGSRRKQFVVEERQGLLQIGRLQLAENLADLLEAANSLAQLGQLRQRRVGAAATIEQAVGLLHQFAQGSQLRQPARDLLEGSTFREREIVLDEEMTMFEEVGDFLLQSLGLTRGSFGIGRGRSAAP